MIPTEWPVHARTGSLRKFSAQIRLLRLSLRLCDGLRHDGLLRSSTCQVLNFTVVALGDFSSAFSVLDRVHRGVSGDSVSQSRTSYYKAQVVQGMGGHLLGPCSAVR